MDPPVVNESSFTAAPSHSSYSFAAEVSTPMRAGGPGLRMSAGSGGGGGDCSLEESTVTDHSGGGKRRRDSWNSFDDWSSKLVPTSNPNQDLINVKRKKPSKLSEENGGSRTEGEENTGLKAKLEPPKDYIHVRARRGQATDSHSLAERARREKISERMNILQDLVPGCNKRQVEFLSMKLEAINATLNHTIHGFP